MQNNEEQWTRQDKGMKLDKNSNWDSVSNFERERERDRLPLLISIFKWLSKLRII